MYDALKVLIVALLTGLTLAGCAGNEQPAIQPASAAPPDSPTVTTVPTRPAPDTGAITDVNKVPVVNPQLGMFPYVGLIDGYQPTTKKPNYHKDVAFDKYEFFDGSKIISVEGRLTTIEAKGQGASAFEVFKTYESLVKNLGGVTIYQGDLEMIRKRKFKFTDGRQRDPVFRKDQVGVYMVRMPEKEIWVEAFVSDFRNKGGYFLTVVEKQALQARASVLPAEEMKKELDAKGHVALYINFDFDKADIKPESRPIIDEIVKLLKDNPQLNLTVEGHTDNVGTPEYNKRLSDARAKSVVAALTVQGVEGRRLRGIGYGQEKPIAENRTDEGRAQNRRVELVKVS